MLVFNIGGVIMSVAFGRLERRRGRLRRGDDDVRYDNDEYDNSFYVWCTGGMSGVASARGDWALRPDGHGESVGVARADFVQDSHRIENDDASKDGGDVDEVVVDGWAEISSEMSFVRGVPGGI